LLLEVFYEKIAKNHTRRKRRIVGSCIAGNDLRYSDEVASLHWLVVSPKFQLKGIGKALCKKVMQIFSKNNKTPIYIHTQPWSYKAIMLYIDQDFVLQKTDSTKTHIQWKNNVTLTALKGKPIRFKFYLTNGDLYAFWVSPWETGESRGYTAGGGKGLNPSGIDKP